MYLTLQNRTIIIIFALLSGTAHAMEKENIKDVQSKGIASTALVHNDVQKISHKSEAALPVDKASCLSTLRGHKGNVTCVQFVDNDMLISSSLDGSIKFWNPSKKIETASLAHTRAPEPIYTLGISPDRTCIAFCSGVLDKQLRLWNLEHKKALGKFLPLLPAVHDICFNADGSLVLSTNENNIQLWNKDKSYDECISTFEGHTKTVNSVDACPSETFIASGSDDQKIGIWSLALGMLLYRLTDHTGSVKAIHFSSDGKSFISSSSDRTVKLWDTRTMKCVGHLSGHNSTVNSVCLSSNGQLAASGSDDKTVKIWDLRTMCSTKTLNGHTNHVLSVHFNPATTLLASSSQDKTIKLWSMGT